MTRKSSRSSTRTRGDEKSTDLATAQLAATRRRLRNLKPRSVQEGKVVGECASCGGKLLETASLERHFAIPGREVVVTGLTGEKCLACGEEWLDAASVGKLVPYQEQKIIARFAGKVSRVGGQSLGTYFSKDIAESMGLTSGLDTNVVILDENHLLITIERSEEEA